MYLLSLSLLSLFIMYQNHEPFHLVSIEPFHLLDGHSTIPTLQFDNREQLWSVHQEGENIGYMIFDESLLKGKLFMINCLFLLNGDAEINGDSESTSANSFAGPSYRLKVAQYLLCGDHALVYHLLPQGHPTGKPILIKG